MTEQRYTAYTCIAALCGILLRCVVSLWGYSGADKGPMFGDYEAQRHWMEITVNLPINEWYFNTSKNDLMYWGLDYPPLTAYHSWICGHIAKWINPDWVELLQSRGFESYEHKLFMRYTVLVADMLVFFPAVYLLFTRQKSTDAINVNKIKAFVMTVLYPGLILIDHGHFQYNCISLGIFLFAVMFLSDGRDLLGSAFFCLALNYKQMELYHAMPFFCFLLGTCFYCRTQNRLWRLIKLAATVILTFALCWLPFLTSVDSAQQVLRRLFPFARGLFEDKVANVWCALSVVVKLKQILPLNQIVSLCFGSTAVCLLPSSIDLLIRPSIRKFKLALVNSSLIFFLFSFQVHEKSILIPALAVCLLIPERPFWCFWFLVTSTFSMLPLVIKDGGLVPFIATMTLFTISYSQMFPLLLGDSSTKGTPVWSEIFINMIFFISLIGMVVLTLATSIVAPSDELPDLFPLLIAVYSCGHFLMFAAYFHYAQFTLDRTVTTKQPAEPSHKEPAARKPHLATKIPVKVSKNKKKRD